MKFWINNLVVICMFTLLGCADKNQEQDLKHELKHLLEVDLVDMEIEHAVLFGFWGDQQIEVDSLPIVNGNIQYVISEKCNKGVYRLNINEYAFDLVYNNENIEIEINPKNPSHLFKVIQSEENKVFFAFQNALNLGLMALDTGNRCDLFSALKIDYLENENTELYTHEIIRFILNADADCFANTSISNSETKSWIASMQLSEQLLASPYFVSEIMKVIHTTSMAYPNRLEDVVNALMETSEKSPVLSHFINVAFWDLGVATGKKKYIQHLFSSSDCLDTGLLAEKKPFELGAIITEDLDSLSVNEGYEEYVYVINNSKCSIVNENWRGFEKKMASENNVKIVRYDVSNLSDAVRKKYNIFGAPMILVTDANKKLVSRWSGFHECMNLTVM